MACSCLTCLLEGALNACVCLVPLASSCVLCVLVSMCPQARDDGKEPAAAAADRAGPSAVESLRTPSLRLRDAVARRAAAFKQQHFKAGGPGAAAGLESEGLQQLRQLCDRLAKDDACVPALLEVGGVGVGARCDVQQVAAAVVCNSGCGAGAAVARLLACLAQVTRVLTKRHCAQRYHDLLAEN
jgi:hypothetical protein